MLEASGPPYASFSLAGSTALAEETVRKTATDLGRVAPATLAAVFVILAVFLRSLVAPLYLVAASVLALGARRSPSRVPRRERDVERQLSHSRAGPRGDRR